jgi:hypothetical protein
MCTYHTLSRLPRQDNRPSGLPYQRQPQAALTYTACPARPAAGDYYSRRVATASAAVGEAGAPDNMILRAHSPGELLPGSGRASVQVATLCGSHTQDRKGCVLCTPDRPLSCHWQGDAPSASAIARTLSSVCWLSIFACPDLDNSPSSWPAAGVVPSCTRTTFPAATVRACGTLQCAVQGTSPDGRNPPDLSFLQHCPGAWVSAPCT